MEKSKSADKKPVAKTAVKVAQKKAVKKSDTVQTKAKAKQKAPSPDSEQLDAEAQAFEAKTSKLTNKIAKKQNLNAQTGEEFDKNTKNLIT